MFLSTKGTYMTNCETAVDAYLSAIREGFDCSVSPNGRLCVVTPYLYPDHDNIEVFIRDKGDRVFVSDLGETLRYLDTNDMDVTGTPKLLFAARRIADGFGVSIHEGVLVKECQAETVGQTIFDVLSAVKSVASLVYGSRAYEPRVFEEEVVDFLASHNWNVERDVPIVGVTGTEYHVKLAFNHREEPYSSKQFLPRRHRGSVRKVNATFRMWSDINGPLSDKTRKLSLLNDDSTLFKPEEVSLLEGVSSVYRWTNPQSLLNAVQNDVPSLA